LFRRTGRDADLRSHAVRPGTAGRIRRPSGSGLFREVRPPGQRHRGPAKRHQGAVGYRLQEIVYVRSDGTVVQASARLTTGSTLIWGRAAGRPAPGGRLRQGGRARGRRLRPL